MKDESENLVRLQKFLSNQGVASRRKCEEFIQDGLVQVNGKTVTELGTKIDPSKDKVTYNKKEIHQIKKAFITICLYKPRSYVCSTSSKEGKSIYDLVKNIPEKIVTAGRLDKKSEGLIILSNDGELVYQLTHPSFEHTKTYHVMVSGDVNSQIIKRLNKPFMMENYKTQPAKVSVIREGEKDKRILLEFILKEGRKRQIRQMCQQLGLNVHRLTRIQIGGYSNKKLKPGEFVKLNQNDILKCLN